MPTEAMLPTIGVRRSPRTPLWHDSEVAFSDPAPRITEQSADRSGTHREWLKLGLKLAGAGLLGFIVYGSVYGYGPAVGIFIGALLLYAILLGYTHLKRRRQARALALLPAEGVFWRGYVAFHDDDFDDVSRFPDITRGTRTATGRQLAGGQLEARMDGLYWIAIPGCEIGGSFFIPWDQVKHVEVSDLPLRPRQSGGALTIAVASDAPALSGTFHGSETRLLDGLRRSPLGDSSQEAATRGCVPERSLAARDLRDPGRTPLAQPDSDGEDTIFDSIAKPEEALSGLSFLLPILGGVLIFTSLDGPTNLGVIGLAVGFGFLFLAFWRIWRGSVTSVEVKANGDILFRLLGRWRLVVNAATIKRVSLSMRRGTSGLLPLTNSRVAIYYRRVGLVLVGGYPQALDLAQLIVTMNAGVKTNRKLRASMNQG